MSVIDASWLKFWGFVSEIGFVMVIVGVIGEGAELLVKWVERRREKATPKKKLTWLLPVETASFVVLVVGLAMEFVGGYIAKQIMDAENVCLTAQVARQKTVITSLDAKTAGITLLPDGTYVVAGCHTGRPDILFDRLEKLFRYYKALDYSGAYEAAKDCIYRYEATGPASHEAGANMSNGLIPLAADNVSDMYAVGAEAALRLRKYDAGLTWAQSAVSVMAKPENKALLVIAFLNTGKRTEADSLINETMQVRGPDIDRFKAVLVQWQLLKE